MGMARPAFMERLFPKERSFVKIKMQCGFDMNVGVRFPMQR